MSILELRDERGRLLTAHRQIGSVGCSCVEKVGVERSRKGFGLLCFALLVGRSEVDKGVRPTVSMEKVR
jgi:hypothetical protein